MNELAPLKQIIGDRPFIENHNFQYDILFQLYFNIVLVNNNKTIPYDFLCAIWANEAKRS